MYDDTNKIAEAVDNLGDRLDETEGENRDQQAGIRYYDRPLADAADVRRNLKVSRGLAVAHAQMLLADQPNWTAGTENEVHLFRETTVHGSPRARAAMGARELVDHAINAATELADEARYVATMIEDALYRLDPAKAAEMHKGAEAVKRLDALRDVVLTVSEVLEVASAIAKQDKAALAVLRAIVKDEIARRADADVAVDATTDEAAAAEAVSWMAEGFRTMRG